MPQTRLPPKWTLKSRTSQVRWKGAMGFAEGLCSMYCTEIAFMMNLALKEYSLKSYMDWFDQALDHIRAGRKMIQSMTLHVTRRFWPACDTGRGGWPLCSQEPFRAAAMRMEVIRGFRQNPQKPAVSRWTQEQHIPHIRRERLPVQWCHCSWPSQTVVTPWPRHRQHWPKVLPILTSILTQHIWHHVAVGCQSNCVRCF